MTTLTNAVLALTLELKRYNDYLELSTPDSTVKREKRSAAVYGKATYNPTTIERRKGTEFLQAKEAEAFGRGGKTTRTRARSSGSIGGGVHKL